MSTIGKLVKLDDQPWVGTEMEWETPFPTYPITAGSILRPFAQHLGCRTSSPPVEFTFQGRSVDLAESLWRQESSEVTGKGVPGEA